MAFQGIVSVGNVSMEKWEVFFKGTGNPRNSLLGLLFFFDIYVCISSDWMLLYRATSVDEY